MPFAQVLGLAGSVVGALGASSAAKSAATAAMYQAQLADQANRRASDLAQQQMGFAQDALSRENQLYDYTLSQNALNQRLALNQRDYGRAITDQNQQLTLQDRQLGLDRLGYADGLTAAERARRIAEINNNQQMSAAERQFAIQQLLQAQRTAQDERAYDIGLYDRQSQQLQAEQDWMRQQFGAQSAQALAERQYDIDQRALMQQRTDRLAQIMAQAYEGLGAPVRAEVLGRGDIEAETARRTNEYMADADRAAQQVASVNEANLIRGGMDSSSTAAARRGEVASRIASEYRNARTRAADDAIKYIGGMQGQLTLAQDLDTQLRNAYIQNLQQVYGAPVEMMQRNPAVASAVQGLTGYQGINSAVNNRNLVSANDYTAKVGINSGIYDANMDLGIGMSNGQIPTTQYISPYGDSGVTGFTLPSVSSAAAFAGNAGSILGGVANNASQSSQYAAQRAAGAAANAGSAWQDLLTKAPSYLDGLFGKGSSPGGKTNPGFIPSLVKGPPTSTIYKGG